MGQNKTQNDRSAHQNIHPAGRVPRQPLVSQNTRRSTSRTRGLLFRSHPVLPVPRFWLCGHPGKMYTRSRGHAPHAGRNTRSVSDARLLVIYQDGKRQSFVRRPSHGHARRSEVSDVTGPYIAPRSCSHAEVDVPHRAALLLQQTGEEEATQAAASGCQREQRGVICITQGKAK